MTFVRGIKSSEGTGARTLVNQTEVQMPADWNDHAGWDDYYRSQVNRTPSQRDIGSIPLERLIGIAEDLKSRGWRSVWIPGCGLSPLPHLLAHLGLNVVATDISVAAVSLQRDGAERFEQLWSTLGPPDSTGSLVTEIHDFRYPYRDDAFDLIINVKAFQGFLLRDKEQIACVHAKAIHKGREAIFDTMNVQGEQRDELETALEDAGFVVPFSTLNRWYRAALRETGIPHAFVLGQPMIPRTGEYAGGPKRDRDTARMREISSEYRLRLQSEQGVEQSRVNANARVAQIIYSTG